LCPELLVQRDNVFGLLLGSIETLEDLKLIRFLVNFLRNVSLAWVRPLIYGEDVRRIHL